jgi:hypothetical protein
MSESSQRVNRSTVGGGIGQRSDAVRAKQDVADTEASGAVSQEIEGKQSSIRVGKLRGYGKISVLAILLIVIVYLIVRYAL